MTDETKDGQGQGEALTIGRVKAIIEKMKAMPAINPDDRKCTKQEAVALMSEDIKEMLGRGYSIEQVAEFLAHENAMEITAPTLKSYMQRAARKDSKTTRRKTRTRLQQADMLADGKQTHGADAQGQPKKAKPALSPDNDMLKQEDI